MAGYTAAPATTDTQIPLSSVQVPGRASPIPLLGSPHTTTDAINNEATAVMVEQSIYGWQRQGQLFIATTGRQTTTTNINITVGFSLFNPSSVKSILVLSARCMQQAGTTTMQLNLTTTDPQLGVPTVVTASNLQAGSAASVLTTTITSAAPATSTSVAITGTPIDFAMTGAAGGFEFIPSNMGILLPAGAANGVALFQVIATAGQFYSMTLRYAEY